MRVGASLKSSWQGQRVVSRRANSLVFQNPESARSSVTRVASARATLAISLSVKRRIPRWVFAEPGAIQSFLRHHRTDPTHPTVDPG